MKKSTVWTLVASISLIVLAFVLVGLSIVSSYDVVSYNTPFGYYKTAVYMNSMTTRLLNTFGRMCFLLGIASMACFVYLAVKNPKKKEECRCSEKQKSASSHTERTAEAMDAEVKSTPVNEVNTTAEEAAVKPENE